MIKPTIGRVVLVRRPENLHPDPEAALVVFVHHDTMINVAGFDHNGVPFARTSVFLDQGDEPVPQWALRSTRAEWMPYQKGQAAKAEALEAAATPR